MGNNTSKQASYRYPSTLTAPTSRNQNDADEKQQLVEQLKSYLTLEDGQDSSSSSVNPITVKNLTAWKEKLLENPKNRLAQSAVMNGSIAEIVQVPTVISNDNVHVFSDVVEFEGSPITNQRSSGRCWLFASTNIFRINVMKQLEIKEFELSQAYLFFYDKLEKSNYFLQNIIETRGLELDDKLIATLLSDPVSDGGQWDMVVNLVEKYGLVPQSLFPDSFNAKNSGKLDYFVVNKLREFALLLRKNPEPETLPLLKQKFIQQIHDILVISLGSPPKPNDEFKWQYFDKNGKAHIIHSTPKSFYKDYVKFDATKYFSLIHDPRNKYEKVYTVDRLNNFVDGKPIEYVNLPIDELKEAAINAIKNNEPVFFGSDVGKYSDTTTGIMDTAAWDYDLAFNTTLNMNKADRVRVGSSAMTHAMVLTGVDIDPETNKPVKWKVMNSWGDLVGDKGYMTMTDEWFDEFVYQVVTTEKYVDKSISDIWKKKNYVVLPRWDPYGSLA